MPFISSTKKYIIATNKFSPPSHYLLKSNIHHILSNKFAKEKIPHLLVIVKELRPTDVDIGVTFKDPTGDVAGIFHKEVLDMFEHDLTVGSAMVLQNVRPLLSSFFLFLISFISVF